MTTKLLSVFIINKGTIPQYHSYAPLALAILVVCCVFNFRISACYIPGHCNFIADDISCFITNIFFFLLLLIYACNSCCLCLCKVLMNHMPYTTAVFLVRRFIDY